MKKFLNVLLMTAMLGTLPACNLTNQDAGVLSGGALGGLLGSQFGHGSGRAAAMTGGAILGAVLGGAIGRDMDRQDQIEAMHYATTYRIGDAHTWRSRETGQQYTVKPVREYYPQHYHRACREYVITARIEGRLERVHGRACQRPDGTWEAVKG